MPALAELEQLEANAALCSRLGLHFVELNMNLPMLQPENLYAAAGLAERYKIGFTVHLDENFAPADFNSLISEAWMETMRRTIRAARAIGAPVINMHLNRGVYFTLPDGRVFLNERYKSLYQARILALRELCDLEIGDSAVQVCIENTNGYLSFQKEAIELLLESRRFALTWDVGHSHNAHMDDEAFLLSHSDRLRHFHIHDADGENDHLALGEGNLALEEALDRARKCAAGCVLEIKTANALEKSVAWLRARGEIPRKIPT